MLLAAACGRDRGRRRRAGCCPASRANGGMRNGSLTTAETASPGVDVQQLARGENRLVVGHDLDDVAARIDRFEREHARLVGQLRVDDAAEARIAQADDALSHLPVGRVQRVALNRGQRLFLRLRDGVASTRVPRGRGGARGWLLRGERQRTATQRHKRDAGEGENMGVLRYYRSERRTTVEASSDMTLKDTKIHLMPRAIVTYGRWSHKPSRWRRLADGSGLSRPRLQRNSLTETSACGVILPIERYACRCRCRDRLRIVARGRRAGGAALVAAAARRRRALVLGASVRGAAAAADLDVESGAVRAARSAHRRVAAGLDRAGGARSRDARRRRVGARPHRRAHDRLGRGAVSRVPRCCGGSTIGVRACATRCRTMRPPSPRLRRAAAGASRGRAAQRAARRRRTPRDGRPPARSTRSSPPASRARIARRRRSRATSCRRGPSARCSTGISAAPASTA